MDFPIDLSEYRPLVFELSNEVLWQMHKKQLEKNTALTRDVIIFATAYSGAKGLGGHTGRGFDVVPEFQIADGFIRGSDLIYPVLYDEAGHGVIVHYAMAYFNGHIPLEKLLHYREFKSGLPGHPEMDLTDGIEFSSGRLGHMWSFVNGVAIANPGMKVIMLGSDGSMEEGNNAEAARFAVANNLEVKLFVDDNDVTISEHVSKYMKGFDMERTLNGHGLAVDSGDGEDLDSLYSRIQMALTTPGPVALINKRKMAPGVEGIEGLPKGHDVIPVELAVKYLESRGHNKAVEMLKSAEKRKSTSVYLGSSAETAKPRDDFGKIVCSILSEMDKEERKQKVLVIDSDLEGSCGLHHIREKFPEVYVEGGVMERNNFSAAAGFGSEPGRQGIFGTFSAFLEMVISEITMANLNDADVLAHFSHAGVDYMADNTCHFGINNLFADNGFVEGDRTRLYFPADSLQMKAVLGKIFYDPGMRFVFSTRSPVPFILDEKGNPFYDTARGYKFMPGKDEVIREGTEGYVVSYGEMLHRSLDAVEQLRNKGAKVGLINKPTLNVVDDEMMEKIGKAPFVLVVESQNKKTGLGIRFGTWLLERGYSPKYDYMGVTRPGEGGIEEQIDYQGLSSDSIRKKITNLLLTLQIR